MIDVLSMMYCTRYIKSNLHSLLLWLSCIVPPDTGFGEGDKMLQTAFSKRAGNHVARHTQCWVMNKGIGKDCVSSCKEVLDINRKLCDLEIISLKFHQNFQLLLHIQKDNMKRYELLTIEVSKTRWN